jgi:phosphoglycolate phosphatase
VEAGLAQLRKKEWRCGVCTNKLERYARQILSDLGLIGFFDVVAGPDTFGIGKPDPGHLLRVIEALNGSAARSLMVGDSEVDVATAKAAGVPIVAVTYGYSKTPLATLGPDLIVEDFDAVVPATARIRAKWDTRDAGSRAKG